MASGQGEQRRLSRGVERATRGRVFGGVCAGLPPIYGLRTRGLRVSFCAAALCGGIGIVVYLACWLVLPGEFEDPDRAPDATRPLVVLGWAVGGLTAVVLLGAASVLATVFGLGWVVFAVAALVLVAAAAGRPPVPAVASLLAIATLTLPAAATAFAFRPAGFALRSGTSVTRPASGAEVSRTIYRGGLGLQFIDLRHTHLPSTGTMQMRVDAGLRPTIVALPLDRCVHVRVHYRVHTFVTKLAALFSGRGGPPFDNVVLFGRVYGGTSRTEPRGIVSNSARHDGPTLNIDFSSLGGSLFVRDYPNDVSPASDTRWPLAATKAFYGTVKLSPRTRRHLDGPCGR